MERPDPSAIMSKKREGGPSRAKNCAECRRLKIKCDRQVPCANCVKRGTASICPDGQLLPKGHRLILSNAEELHAKIEELTARIVELEEALAKLQAEHSDAPHPLLATPNDEPLVTSFGSLMIGKDGNSRFFGATSSVEWVMMMDSIVKSDVHEEAEDSPVTGDDPLQETSDLALINSSFPLLVSEEHVNIPELRRRVISGLPERELGTVLLENYYGRVAWEMAPVLRTRFVSEYFTPCYANPENPPISAHKLAFVYAIFGLGMLHSPEIKNSTVISRHYIVLSQACLTTDSPFGNTTITCIDTLLLHAAYIYKCDDLQSPPKAWATLGVAMKLAQMIGLHREPSMWNLPAIEVTRRRRTMWELVSCDLWASLISGRPPMISRQHFDVQMPIEAPDVTEPDPNFSLGKHHFSEACLWSVLDIGLASANKRTYAAVIKVDTKIREWRLPNSLLTKATEPAEGQKTMANFRSATEMIFREITLMCLHRCYFAAALLDPHFDLLKNQYSRSVLAAYASSCAILGRVRALYALEPVIIMKFSFFWTHGFSAAIILGAIAARAPDCSLASAALVEFDLAVELFTCAQDTGIRARRGLPTLLHLQSSAHTAREAFQYGTWSRQNPPDATLLQALGGAGAVLHRQDNNPAPVPETSSGVQNDHPMLDQYLRSFDFNSGPDNNSSPLFLPTSDEFLQGVLSGDWSGLFPSPSSNTPSGFDYSTNIAAQGQPEISFDYNGLQPPKATYTSSRYSDGGSSINSGGIPLAPASSIEPPPLLHQPSAQVPHPLTSQSDEFQKSFLWDNFLCELGINN